MALDTTLPHCQGEDEASSRLEALKDLLGHSMNDSIHLEPVIQARVLASMAEKCA